LRVERIYSWSAANSSCYSVKGNGARDEDSGHGTHVSVSILGEGNALGQGRGAAPAAHLVFQAVEEYLQMKGLCGALYPNGYYLIGIPDDLRPLFQQAYDAGARIHSNSWGSDAQGDYTIDSANADDFVWTHPQMTITYSAGNAGIDADADGVIDPDSIGSPATAKNVITVGASENDRRGDYGCATELTYTGCAGQGGQNTLPTYGEAWPDDYPAEPIAGDPNAGNEEQMAAFSSRGPTDDGRIKPDVVAPGTWVLSGYSDLHQQGYDTTTNQLGSYQYDGWGFPLNRELKYMGGTSMSNPLVAGAAAVVRDFYQTAHGHGASAALVKATLINSAVDLLDENNDGIDDNDAPIPNEHEGWGRVDLVDATDGSRQFVDEETDLQTGETATYAFDVAASEQPFKATLVWTDYPSTESAAKNLVNDLDVVVTAPDGTAYRGNVFDGGWSQAGGTADRTNNVENVYVRTPAAGTWTVEVRGFNVPDGPQPFALVVSGGAAAAVDEPPSTTVTDPGAPIDGTYRVLVGAGDDGAVDKVELAIDGGTSVDITANVAGEFYFYDWDTTGVADGTHTLRSRATDDSGRTAVSTPVEVTVENIVDPPVAGLHVGDLDGSATSGLFNWTAVVEIAVHDGDEQGVAGAAVRGTWGGGAKGSGYCTTDGSGRCRISKWSRKGSVSFTVGTVTHPTLAYRPDDNHDPDGDSDGTTITVPQP
jgi:hypothetical protein